MNRDPFFQLPVEVYDVLVQYLEDAEVNTLGTVSSDTQTRVASITRDTYWRERLSTLLEMEPADLELGSTTAEELYKEIAHKREIIDLVRAVMDADYDQEYPDKLLLYAMQNNMNGIVKLVTGSTSANTNYAYVLDYAVETGLESSAIHIIRHHPEVDPTVRNNHYLVYAATWGMEYLVNVLLEETDKSSSKYGDALLAAVNGKHYWIVRSLLKDGRANVSFEEAKELAYRVATREIIDLFEDYEANM